MAKLDVVATNQNFKFEGVVVFFVTLQKQKVKYKQIDQELMQSEPKAHIHKQSGKN